MSGGIFDCDLVFEICACFLDTMSDGVQPFRLINWTLDLVLVTNIKSRVNAYLVQDPVLSWYRRLYKAEADWLVAVAVRRMSR